MERKLRIECYNLTTKSWLLVSLFGEDFKSLENLSHQFHIFNIKNILLSIILQRNKTTQKKCTKKLNYIFTFIKYN